MKKIDALNGEIKSTRAKLEKLEAEKDLLESDDRYAIAETLHSMRCRLNHTDGCSWYYETWDSSTPAGNSERARWLEKADTVIEAAEKRGMKPSDLIEIMDMV
jgi:hypothetical protein